MDVATSVVLELKSISFQNKIMVFCKLIKALGILKNRDFLIKVRWFSLCRGEILSSYILIFKFKECRIRLFSICVSELKMFNFRSRIVLKYFKNTIYFRFSLPDFPD